MPVTRRSFVISASAAGGVLHSAQRPRPNILWLSCEDTGPEIGCYGAPNALTPVIDRLASQGVRYTHAYTVAGVCAPSRSGIITGMYPSTLGSHYMRCRAALPDFVKCFPEYLRQAGYYCTNNVKTDYNFDPPSSAWDESSRKAHWNNRAKGQPFFAVFNDEVTHESRVRMRGAEYDKLVERLTASQRRDPASVKLPPYHPDTPPSRRDWANYHELITAMDYKAGDRLKELEDAGLLEDTIVFFWGDHGVGLPRSKRWLYESGTHVPLVIRIPEKFRTSGQGAPGSVDNQLISFIDLAPTVLNLAGAPIPGHMQGRAFLGPNLTPPREYIYGARDRMDERYDIVRMVRDRRYRYIRNYEPHKPYAQHLSYMEQGYVMKELRRLHAEGKTPPGARLFMGEDKPVEELYDVAADPHELNNLASSANHRKALERLRAEHERWSLETRDLALIPEPEVAALEKRHGTRHAIFRRPGSEEYIRRLRALVDAVNRGSDAGLVRRALDDPDPAFRYWAVIGIRKTERVIKSMEDASPVVRIAAAQAASKYLSDARAVPLLVRELGSEEEFVRLHAIIALDELGAAAKSALPAIRAAFEDKRSNYVQRVAEHAVAQLGG